MQREVYLPDTTALPGKIRLYPFQRGIADAISDPLIERVSVLKSARVGYTTLLIGAIANHVVNDPAPVLVVRPTDADCAAFVTSDIEPTFAASPALKGVLSGDQLELNRNTMLSRRFPGGSLKVVAARSPNNLSDKTARILVLDEVDRMEMTKEGDPVALAIRRTMTFADRKIVMGSTPVLEATSHIIKAYDESDQRVFEVPCPDCGDFHEVTWKDIQWPEGQPDKPFYCCPSCGSAVEETHKPAMVEAGRWRATRPEVKGHAGFRINSLVSPVPNAAWPILVAEFLVAKKEPATLQTFTNTVLGEGWKEAGEEIDDIALMARAEPFSLDNLPEDVLSITSGTDVQHNRLETTLLGHSAQGRIYVLGHHVFHGPWDSPEVWDELDALLTTRWRHPFGGTLGIDAATVDSGDGLTMRAVYEFTGPRTNRRVMAIKGVGGQKLWITKSNQKSQRVPFWLVGTDPVKTYLLERVKHPHLFAFSDTLDEEWFIQLAGERAVVRFFRGRPKVEFAPVSGRRHEALDCTVYAIAAQKTLAINYLVREQELRRPDVAPTTRRRFRDSSFISGEAA